MVFALRVGRTSCVESFWRSCIFSPSPCYYYYYYCLLLLLVLLLLLLRLLRLLSLSLPLPLPLPPRLLLLLLLKTVFESPLLRLEVNWVREEGLSNIRQARASDA